MIAPRKPYSSGASHEPRIYFVEAPSVGLIKIGWSSNIEARLVGIRNQELDGTLVGQEVIVIGSVLGDAFDETTLHKHFWCAHVRGEWFQADAIRPFVEDILQLGDENVASWFAWHRRHLDAARAKQAARWAAIDAAAIAAVECAS